MRNSNDKNYINLYVDDLRDCPDGYEIARTVEEALYYINLYNINILSLDHDLGIDDKGVLLKNGYDLVKIICEKGIRVNKIYLHTDNPVGRDNMYYLLIGAIKHGVLNSNVKVYNYSITPNIYTLK